MVKLITSGAPLLFATLDDFLSPIKAICSEFGYHSSYVERDEGGGRLDWDLEHEFNRGHELKWDKEEIAVLQEEGKPVVRDLEAVKEYPCLGDLTLRIGTGLFRLTSGGVIIYGGPEYNGVLARSHNNHRSVPITQQTAEEIAALCKRIDKYFETHQKGDISVLGYGGKRYRIPVEIPKEANQLSVLKEVRL